MIEKYLRKIIQQLLLMFYILKKWENVEFIFQYITQDVKKSYLFNDL